jgi:glycerate-2-kinase
MQKIVDDLNQIIQSAISAVIPKNIFLKKVKIDESKLYINTLELDLSRFEKIFVIGFGKASSSMATELEKILYQRIYKGIVITKYGFKTPTNKIKIFEAGHPLLDENSIKHSKKILELLKESNENDLVICLISGGGSALFEVVLDEIDLKTLQLINEKLVKSEIPIHKINHYRKAISEVKGGKLLKFIYPSTCLSLIISDVVGDDLSTIASGPTFINENKTYNLIKDYKKLKDSLNKSDFLDEFDKLISTEKFDHKILNYYESKVYNFIVASNSDAMKAAIAQAKNLGYEIHSTYFDLSAELNLVVYKIIDEIQTISLDENTFKKMILFGGEPFLEVKGKGLGGRNSHLILLLLKKLIEKKLKLDFQFVVASFATDGNDGPTDSAGAFITNEVIEKVLSEKINLDYYLNNFDSYNFFKSINCLIKTGPTYTNVMDLIVGLFKKKI